MIDKELWKGFAAWWSSIRTVEEKDNIRKTTSDIIDRRERKERVKSLSEELLEVEEDE